MDSWDTPQASKDTLSFQWVFLGRPRSFQKPFGSTVSAPKNAHNVCRSNTLPASPILQTRLQELCSRSLCQLEIDKMIRTKRIFFWVNCKWCIFTIFYPTLTFPKLFFETWELRPKDHLRPFLERHMLGVEDHLDPWSHVVSQFLCPFVRWKLVFVTFPKKNPNMCIYIYTWKKWI